MEKINRLGEFMGYEKSFFMSKEELNSKKEKKRQTQLLRNICRENHRNKTYYKHMKYNPLYNHNRGYLRQNE
jgi:hypothetical protein